MSLGNRSTPPLTSMGIVFIAIAKYVSGEAISMILVCEREKRLERTNK